MIPKSFIMEWGQHVPWQSDQQIEQDLVICRSLVELFSDPWLASRLAFRGGTALHKLHLRPQPRYSEDIDLVQVHPEPIKDTIRRIQMALAFLGESAVRPRRDGFQILWYFETEIPPCVRSRLKVEINTREHFEEWGLEKIPFHVDSGWFRRGCDLTTFRLEELLGTKLRALYQRKKGRDLFDLYQALRYGPELDMGAVMASYERSMDFTGRLPTARQFLLNLENKLQDEDFLGDTAALLRPDVDYDPAQAFRLIREIILHQR